MGNKRALEYLRKYPISNYINPHNQSVGKYQASDAMMV